MGKGSSCIYLSTLLEGQRLIEDSPELCCGAAGSKQSQRGAAPPPTHPTSPQEGLPDSFCSPFAPQVPCPAL